MVAVVIPLNPRGLGAGVEGFFAPQAKNRHVANLDDLVMWLSHLVLFRVVRSLDVLFFRFVELA